MWVRLCSLLLPFTTLWTMWVMAVFIAKLFAHSLAWDIAAAIDHFLNHGVKVVFVCTACSILLLNTNCMEVSFQFSLRHCCCHSPLSEPCWYGCVHCQIFHMQPSLRHSASIDHSTMWVSIPTAWREVSVQFSLRHCCCHSPLFEPCAYGCVHSQTFHTQPSLGHWCCQ